MGIMDILDEFHKELKRAERKFPEYPVDCIHAASILNEEAGELIRAALRFSYEGATKSEMREEAVQVGAMALRFLLNFDAIEPVKSNMHNRRIN